MRVLVLSAALCFFSLPLMAAEMTESQRATRAAIEQEGEIARAQGMRSIAIASRITDYPDALQCLEKIKDAKFQRADYSDDRHQYFRVYKEGSLTPDYYLTVTDYGFKQPQGSRGLVYVPPDEARNHGPVLAKILACIPV